MDSDLSQVSVTDLSPYLTLLYPRRPPPCYASCLPRESNPFPPHASGYQITSEQFTAPEGAASLDAKPMEGTSRLPGHLRSLALVLGPNRSIVVVGFPSPSDRHPMLSWTSVVECSKKGEGK